MQNIHKWTCRMVVYRPWEWKERASVRWSAGKTACFSPFVEHKVAKWPATMLPTISHKSNFPWSKMFHVCLTVHHTSKSESLSVTERMVPPSPRSFILETLVVGLAAAQGDSAELCGVHPDSDMERRPLWPSPWCWSLKTHGVRKYDYLCNIISSYTYITATVRTRPCL